MNKSSVDGASKAAFAVALVLTVIAQAADDSLVTLLLAPVIYLILVFVMSRVPIRLSMLGLMFAALTLQDAADSSAAKFIPPFAGVGAVLFTHLNAVDRQVVPGWVSFSGVDFLLIALLLIALARRSGKSKLDKVGNFPVPRPLTRFAYLSLGSTAWVWLLGLARGGDFGMSLWQLNRVMYLPVLFLLFSLGLRGPKDLGALLKVILVAAIYKALLCFYIVMTVTMPPDPLTGSTHPAWATSHQDSILFATAFVSVLAVLLERAVPRKQIKWYALLLPILGAGTWANNRRMAWVQVLMVFVTVYLISNPNNPVKRKITRAMYIALPVLAVYLAIGWGSDSKIFKPVHMLRSVVEPSTDGSTLWRELENFDIIMTFRTSPIFGTGYGHPYLEIVQLPAVDYSLERYAPHNSILGLWAFCGYVGYATLTLLWAVGVYFALRTYRSSKEPSYRAASLVSFGTVLVFLIQCWGDLGLGSWIGVFSMAPALATAGKLAVASGQWPALKPAPAPAAVAAK
jgi:hypothetical protein